MLTCMLTKVCSIFLINEKLRSEPEYTKEPRIHECTTPTTPSPSPTDHGIRDAPFSVGTTRELEDSQGASSSIGTDMFSRSNAQE